MRSVVVVFPASMWAMMPMLRMRSSGVVLGIASCWGTPLACPYPFSQQKRGATWPPANGPVSLRHHRGAFDPLDAGSLQAGSRSCRSKRLPPVMCESPIGLRHPVRVLFLLDRLAFALRRQDQLGGEPLRHVLLAPGAAELDQPPHPQRGAPFRPDLDRHLVRRAAHSAGLHFERRLHVRQRLLEDVHARL